MIVKINDQYMTSAVLNTNEPPQGFEFFPAFKAGTQTFCYVTDGMSNYIGVPFQAVGMPDPVINNLPRMVGVEILDEHGLPHGKP
jgi:hypothetical protein